VALHIGIQFIGQRAGKRKDIATSPNPLCLRLPDATPTGTDECWICIHPENGRWQDIGKDNLLLISWLPATGRVWQKIRGYREIEDTAERSIVVSPEETWSLPEAIYLPGQLDRITGTHQMAASLTDEINQTLSPRLENIASKAFLVRNAVIAHDRVTTWSSFKDLSLKAAKSRPFRVLEKVEAGALCSTWQGNDFFAHFLVDDLASHTLASQFANPFFAGHDEPRTAHCHDYMSRLDIDYAHKRNVHVRDLWLFRDFSLGADKRGRLRNMAERIKTALPVAHPSPGAFVRRGTTGQIRVLENAAEIEEWCVAQGFAIIDPEKQSVSEICEALNGVPLVIGVEGSQLVHALFTMSSGGTLICVQPADRFNAIFRHLCAVFDLNWSFVVAKGSTVGFYLDLDELRATLELIQSRTTAS
jgi:hypothetical protein